MSDFRRFAAGAGVVALFAGLTALIIYAVRAEHRAQQAWEADCHTRGGSVTSTSDTRVGVGIDAKGRPVTTITTDTTYYCLADGRVLGIRS